MLLEGPRNTVPLRRFRRFRNTRPFWGGLFVLAAGVVIAVLPIGPTDQLIHAGKGVFAGAACGLLLLLMGAVIWFLPSQRLIAGTIAVLVSLASFVLSNLGGFVVGMLLGILGGSLAFGWVPDRQTYHRRKGQGLLYRHGVERDGRLTDLVKDAEAVHPRPTPDGRTEFAARGAPS
ncbi:MAG: DUF6114 domain-containing protein [Jatrophihabitans sp.]